jgi:hypothetical protein
MPREAVFKNSSSSFLPNSNHHIALRDPQKDSMHYKVGMNCSVFSFLVLLRLLQSKKIVARAE